MVYGENLAGLSAEFDGGAIPVRGVHTPENANYAFVDITVSDDVEPGAYELVLSNGSSSASIGFPILERDRRQPRYQGFDANDVVYLLTPDRFANGDPSNDRIEGLLDEYDPTNPRMRHGGDLEGMIARLDYLRELGITTIWPMPVLENSGRNSYHGYAATNLYRIDPRLGTNEDYRRFVEAAHEHGLKVIFDHINNHIGIRHPWLSSLPMADWLNGSAEDHLSDRHYKLSVTDPHADPKSVELLKTFWFVDRMPDLNQRNPYVSTYLIQNTLWWIEYSGLDGIREDTYPYADQDFLTRWEGAILEEYPDFNIVGEIWDDYDPAYQAAHQAGNRLPGSLNTNLPTVMDFPLATTLRAYVSGAPWPRGNRPLYQIYSIFAADHVYADPQKILTFVDNHDMSRAIFIADGDTPRVKQALAILLTARGIPQLLYGTEINMMGGASHVELRADFPGGFPGDERNAFTAEGRTEQENDMFDFVSSLLHARNRHEALRTGKMTHYPPSWSRDFYRYVRSTDDEQVLVVVSGYDEPRTADLTELAHWFSPRQHFRDLVTGEELEVDLAQGLTMDPRGLRVLLATD
jgi:glycosidase